LTDLRKDSTNFLRFLTLMVVLSSSWYLSIVLLNWSWSATFDNCTCQSIVSM